MERSSARQALWVLRQFGVVVLGIVVYFGVRGLTAGKPHIAVENAHDVLRLENSLAIDQEQRIQDLILGHAWLVDLANWIYIWGHWPVIAVVMVWLATRHQEAFLRLRNAMLASGGVGLIIYATYPVSPPRLTNLGLTDTVTERSEAYRILQPPAFVNQYAAMPSLHVGWDLLVGLAVASAAGSLLLRWIGRLMPVLMAGAVVLTANHYFLDVVAGIGLALAGLAFALWLERWSARRALRPEEPRQIDLTQPRPYVPVSRRAPDIETSTFRRLVD